MRKLARIAVAGALLGLTVVMGLGPPGAQHTASAQGEEVDLSVDSEVTSAPTDLDLGVNGTLSVTTTGTHTNAPLGDTVEARISHTVSVPQDCIVNSGAQATDSWTGDLAGGASHVLTTDFTIRCVEPSNHTFFVDNEIELLEPGYADPNMTNNIDVINVPVNVWAVSDIKLNSFTPLWTGWKVDSNGDTIADLAVMNVGTPTNVTLRKVIHNNGPYGPTAVNLTKMAQVVPLPPPYNQAATVTPASDSEQPLVPVSIATTVDEVFQITCLDAGLGKVTVFAFTNIVGIKDPHITDPSPIAPFTVQLPVLCFPRFTPTFDAKIKTDDGTLNPPGAADVCILGLPCKTLTSIAIPADMPLQPLALIQTILPAAFTLAPSSAVPNGATVGQVTFSVIAHLQGVTPGCVIFVGGAMTLYDAAMPAEGIPPSPLQYGLALFPNTYNVPPGAPGLGWTYWSPLLTAVTNFVAVKYPGAILWDRHVGVVAALGMPVNVLTWKLPATPMLCPTGNCWLSIGVTKNPDNDGDGLWDSLVDADDDNDTVPNSVDNCDVLANPDQLNADGDSVGDVCDPNPLIVDPSDPETYNCTPYYTDTINLGNSIAPVAFLRSCDVFGTQTVIELLTRLDTGETTVLTDQVACIDTKTDLEVQLHKNENIEVGEDLSHTETVDVSVYNNGAAPTDYSVQLVQVSTDKDKCLSHLVAEAGDTLDEWTDGNQYYSKLTWTEPELGAFTARTSSRDYEIVCSQSGSFPNIEQFLVDVQPITMEETDPADNTAENFVSVDVQAVSDIKINSFSVVYPRLIDSNGDTVPDLPVVDVGTPTDIIVRKVLHNNGPYGPTEVTLAKEASVLAGDATVTPLTDQEQAILPASSPVTVDETFSVHCLDSNVGGMAVFEFDNEVTIKDANVQDPDGASATTTFAALCVPRFTPTFALTFDEDDGTLNPPVDDVCILGLPCKTLISIAIPADTPKQPLSSRQMIYAIYPAALNITPSTSTTTGSVVGQSSFSVVAHLQDVVPGCALTIGGIATQYDAALAPEGATNSPYALFPGTGDCVSAPPAGFCGFVNWPNQLNAVDNFVQANYPGSTLWARYVGVVAELGIPINILVWKLADGRWLSIAQATNPDNDLDGLWDYLLDTDDDNDGIPDGRPRDNAPDSCTGGQTVGCADNCPLLPNATQADLDWDGVGDACDPLPTVPNHDLDMPTYTCSPYSSQTLFLGEALIPPYPTNGEILRTCTVFGTHTVVAILIREDTGETTIRTDTINCISVDTDLEVELLKDELITVPKDLVHTETVQVSVYNNGPPPTDYEVQLEQVSTERDKCVSHLVPQGGDTLDEWTDGNQFHSKLTWPEPTLGPYSTHVSSRDYEIVCSVAGSFPNIEQFLVDVQPITMEETDPSDNAAENHVSVDVQAVSDIKINSFSVVYNRKIDSNGDTVPDLPVVDVGADTNVILRKVLHNNGPYGPTEVTLTKTAAVLAGDATVTPLTDQEQAILPVSSPVTVDETFSVHCLDSWAGRVAVFAFTNEVTIKDAHVVDPDGASASTTFPVYCAPHFTPTFALTIDEDDGSMNPPVDDVCIMGLPCKALTHVAIPADTPKQPLALIQTIYPAAIDTAHGTTITNGSVVGKVNFQVGIHIQGMTPWTCTETLGGTVTHFDACLPPSIEPACLVDNTGQALLPPYTSPAGWGTTHWPNQLNAILPFVAARYPGAQLWARYVGTTGPPLNVPINFLVWKLADGRWLSIGITGNPDNDLDGLWGDVVDWDDDNDGIPNGRPRDDPRPRSAICTGGQTVGCVDNCPVNANPDQLDTDGDLVGDVCDPNPGTNNPSDKPTFTCTPYSVDNLALGKGQTWTPSPPYPPSGETLRTCEVFGQHTVTEILLRQDTGEATVLNDTINCITAETDLEVALVKNELITVPKDLAHTETVDVSVYNNSPAPTDYQVELMQVSTERDTCVSHLVPEPGDTLYEYTDGNQFYSKLTWTEPTLGPYSTRVSSRDYEIVCSQSGSFPNIEQFLVDVQPITMAETDPSDNTDENHVSVDSDPDVDGDTILNADDACPFDPEDFDGIQDEDGCPETDADGDGVLDEDDACPEDAEDLDGIQDEDGCPETDADNDGMPDDYEQAHACLNPLVHDAAGDPDGDGLTNIDEMDAGTDPCDDDSDGDTFPDDQELSLGSDPLNAASTPEHISLPWTCTDGIDNDLDSLPDLLDCDTDSDGIANYCDPCPFRAEDMDGYQDNDGCPDTDNDMDGVCDPWAPPSQPACTGSDGCPNVAETIDGFKDTDGCPDPDNDGDGFPDSTDQCPATDWTAGPDGIADSGDEPLDELGVPIKTKEDYDGIIDWDGCHDSPSDDWDGDGMSDEVEVLQAGTDPTDMDTDDDGLCDGHKPPLCASEDTNNNGVVDPGETDPTNPDTDGDGLSDGLERGLVVPETPDTDTSSPNWQPDADPSSTTDPANPDSDDDGVDDGAEDPNHSGAVDPGETAPGDDDTDDDAFNDGLELYLGTDSTDNCPDVVGADDAWPLDNDITKDITVTGDVFAYVGRIGAHGPPSPSPNWRQRLDLDVSGDISVTGDVYRYVGRIGETCE